LDFDPENSFLLVWSSHTFVFHIAVFLCKTFCSFSGKILSLWVVDQKLYIGPVEKVVIQPNFSGAVRKEYFAVRNVAAEVSYVELQFYSNHHHLIWRTTVTEADFAVSP
jgi:hypothetical protein